jgi:hypothetical protein
MLQRKPIQIRWSIDVPQRRKLVPHDSGRAKQRACGGKHGFGPPSNAAKHFRKFGSCTNENVSAVFSWPKYDGPFRFKRGVRRLQVGGIKARAIGADNDARAILANSTPKGATHAITEIALSLF